MRLSVVIPMRDSERFIMPLLENLGDQGLSPSDYEVVIVDDGSSDGTAGILTCEAERRPNLRTFRLSSRGAGAARNAGMDAARGDHLYFMDADDVLEPYSLRRLLERCEREDLDCLLFGGEPFYETLELEAALPQYRGLLERRWAPGGIVSGRDAVIGQAQAGNFCPCVWLMMLKTSAVRAAGVRFPEGIVNEDNAFALRAMLASGRLAVDPASYYRYSIREGSVTSGNRTGEARWIAHLKLLDIFEGEARGAEAASDHELAFAIRELSSWFVEVCVRDCPEDPLRVLQEVPMPTGAMTSGARLARRAADERTRAEVAEASVRDLERRIGMLERPGIRRWLSLLRLSVVSGLRIAL